MNDPTKWIDDASASISVGDPMTEAWLDRFRELMTAYNAATRVVTLADEWLLVGEGVGLRYYIEDLKERAEFDAALAAANISLKSDKPR